MGEQRRNRKRKKRRKHDMLMDVRRKLLVVFAGILVAFFLLTFRLYAISRDNEEDYKKQILSQQEYDSKIIPFKRGNIIDANGTILAVSNKVYNVILDTKILLSKEEYLEPTLDALHTAFGLDISEIRRYVEENPSSQYYVLAKKLSYDQVSKYQEIMDNADASVRSNSVWFEEEYQRQYPNKTLGCDVIGFMVDEQSGYGLESYYNDVLCGINGREYGYLNEDSTLERTTIAAQEGNTIVTTIDSNIQAIVEKYLKEFNEEYKDNVRTGNGAENIGCVIMEVDTGNVLAMASYPFYDLNNPRDSKQLIGMRQVDYKGNKTKGKVDDKLLESLEEHEEDSSEKAEVLSQKYVTEESLAAMDDALLYQNFDALWKNFCINDTYEPGSVSKPFTVASAIDCGAITGNEGYNCEGKLHVGDHDIKCHNVYGDGYLTVQQGIERSCNVVLMHVASTMGKEQFLRYQRNFGFGLKTNIDLAGESRTDSLVYNQKTMGPTDLATNSFGQGFNTTMIQMITGFCSLINGGNLYEPHMVSKILTADGATLQNIEPRILKQTVSPSTSEKVLAYCNTVVTGENGTGKTARPAGYMIGGKTGTAQTLPRGNNEYVVSFMGYAPADDPQIAIYVVVDRPNVHIQADAKFATRIVRNVLTEVLPYLHIYMTEELTDKERQELEEKQLQDTIIMQERAAQLGLEEGTQTENHEQTQESEAEVETGEETEANPEGEAEGSTEEQQMEREEPWKEFPIDPATGYALDPENGYLVDPETGVVVSGLEQEEENDTQEESQEE